MNSKDYWVSTSITNADKWVKLPLITRDHIRQARNIKYIFKGHLDHNIVSSPVFSGLEKHLVKKKITRSN